MHRRLTRLAPWGLLLLYFVVATLCNAWITSRGLSMQTLDVRAYDFGWELGLPWQASLGQWVGRDFDYPMGPLWQALGLVGLAAVREYDAKSALFALHVVFPLISLALCLALTRCTEGSRRERLATFAVLALFALHDDVRTLRSWVSLAVVLTYTAASEERHRRWIIYTALLVVGGTLLSFETGVLGLVSLVCVAAADLAFFAGRKALWPLARTLSAVVLALLVSSLAFGVLGGNVWRALLGWLEVSRAYVVTMVEGRHDLPLAPLVAFCVLGFIISVWSVQARDRRSALWLAGVAPLSLRALIRNDAEHVYAALAPAAAVLALLFIHAPRRAHWRVASAALLSSCFALAWFGTRHATPTAWRPAAIVQVLRGRLPTTSEVLDNDLGRAVDYARGLAPGSCVVMPERLSVVHPLSGVPGPTVSVLRWTPGMKERLTKRIQTERCEHAVRQIVAFDLPAPYQSIGFGEDFVALSEMYETTRRLGPASYAATLRPTPKPSPTRALALSEGKGDYDVSIPGRLRLGFSQRLPVDHLVRFKYRLDIPGWRWLIGGAPALRVQFFDGETPVGPPMVMPDVDVGREVTAVIPVEAEIAEWRWVGRVPAATTASATHMELRLEARRLGAKAGQLHLDDFELLSPPIPALAEGSRCAKEDSLLEPQRQSSVLARAEALDIKGDRLHLSPNPPGQPLAEVFFPVVPCDGTCFFADLVAEENLAPQGVDFEVHVIRGAERPLRVDWRMFPRAHRLLRVPLFDVSHREVLLRLGTKFAGSPGPGSLQVVRPRVAACSPLPSLLQAALGHGTERTRGNSWVDDDKIVLEPAAFGEPPTELRIPIRYPRGTCLALEMYAEGASEAAPIAIDVGFFSAPHVIRLAREVQRGGEPARVFRDLPLDEFAEQDVSLRIAAWSRDGKSPLLAVLRQPVLHECGGVPTFER